MANVLNSASANPSTIPSGGQTAVTLNYDADKPGTVFITASTGYTVAPTSAKIVNAPGAGLNTLINVKITGPSGDCTLAFSFFGDTTSTIVTIQ